jgi:hypothetical protein
MPPAFREPDDSARVAHSGLRGRMIDGTWADDAADRHRQFFSDATWEFLPPPDLSHNAFLLYTDAKSTIYDDPYKTIPEDAPEILTTELRALQQENLRYVNALNEGVMRVDVVDGRITYRVVRVDCVGDAESSSNRPDVPMAITEIRPRSYVDPQGVKVSEFTMERWDVRDPAKPIFEIKAYRQTVSGGDPVLVDVTREYVPDLEQGEYPYPYRDTAGAPIFPYVLYHSKVGNVLFRPWAGMEVVEGTLNASALWTFWMMGVRDGAHPQRWTIDLDVDGMTLRKPDSSPAQGYVQMNPAAILRFKSKSDRGGSAGQFQPAMTPSDMAEANLQYEASLSQFAGVDAPDVQRSASSSGYALVVSQDGKRKAAKKLETPCRMADTLLFATASRLANAYLSVTPPLPESPEEWSITYAKPRRSIDEIKAGYEEAKAMVDLGVWDEVDVVQHLHPELTQAQAVANILDKRATRALLNPVAPVNVANPPPSDTTTTPPPAPT